MRNIRCSPIHKNAIIQTPSHGVKIAAARRLGQRPALGYDGLMDIATPGSHGAAGNSVLTVSGLNRLARSLLEDCFPSVVVEGEISNLAMPASGHWYLTLKDDKAQIRCAMFRSRNRGVRFRPQNGQQIQVRGKLSVYEARGDYQLVLDDMQEAGAGALQRAFEQLKARLSEEGLFDESRKKPLPAHCRHVGVITSATGAAIRDILSVFQRRFPAMRITLLPVAVQGVESPEAIVTALRRANRRAGELGLEALIVGRGGGSLEDLQPFNEESVARAISASELPVVAAVGHESDVSIADFVADVRAPTPSAAAELLSPDQQAWLRHCHSQQQRLQRLIAEKLQNYRQQLQFLGRRLIHPGRRLQEHAQTLDTLEGRLHRALRNRLNTAESRVQQLRGRLLLRSPLQTLRQRRLQGHNLQQRLNRAMHTLLERKQNRLRQASRGLEAISPLQTLSRGYSITEDADGRVLRCSTDVSAGDRLSTRLAEGRIISIVEEPVS